MNIFLTAYYNQLSTIAIIDLAEDDEKILYLNKDANIYDLDGPEVVHLEKLSSDKQLLQLKMKDTIFKRGANFRFTGKEAP